MNVLIASGECPRGKRSLLVKYAIVEMIEKNGADTFYIRNSGSLQTFSVYILNSLRKKYNVRINLYTPFIECKHTNLIYYSDPSVHCFEEEKLPGYNPVEKDRIMLDRCEGLITNFKNKSAGILKTAAERKLKIINIADYPDPTAEPLYETEKTLYRI